MSADQDAQILTFSTLYWKSQDKLEDCYQVSLFLSLLSFKLSSATSFSSSLNVMFSSPLIILFHFGCFPGCLYHSCRVSPS